MLYFNKWKTTNSPDRLSEMMIGILEYDKVNIKRQILDHVGQDIIKLTKKFATV